MIASEQAAGSARRTPVHDTSARVPGTSLSVAEVCAIMAHRRGCEELFRRFPDLDPNDLRDAVERAARHAANDPPSRTAELARCSEPPAEGQSQG
ncbi:MAG TPA: hypothetical protein VFL97_02345 [Nitrococcus sp.]|nr:hypothetical protein [Nitrococcus sp.]